jgi:hypothetical protein
LTFGEREQFQGHPVGHARASHYSHLVMPIPMAR